MVRKPALKAHPYADIFPPLEGEPFDNLVADIKANGLLQPITICENQILDGRNRLHACEAAEIEPRFVEYNGDDPLSFVLSRNLHRRHLDESQRAMVASRIANMRQGERTDLQPSANLLKVSQADAAKRLNVSERSVTFAALIEKQATPDLVHAVEQGKIAVSVAAGLATAPKAIQHQAVAEPERSCSRQAEPPHAARIGTRGQATGVAYAGLWRQPHLLVSVNFIDPPTRLLVVDFHGLTPDAGADLGKPECFGRPIVDTLRARFAAIGIHSMARAKMVLVAMPSTGAKRNSQGDPARGCARFRVLFELDVSLPVKRHAVFLTAFEDLRGFHRLDDKGKPSGCCVGSCWPGHGDIVARPMLPKGMKDPITEPVQIFDGETPFVDVRALMRELRPGEPLPRDPRYTNVMSEWRGPWLEALVKDLSSWSVPPIDLGPAIWGASGGEPWGRDIWMEWRARRKLNGHGDSEKAWEALDDGVSGIDDLLRWAREAGMESHALGFASLIDLHIFPVIEIVEVGR